MLFCTNEDSTRRSCWRVGSPTNHGNEPLSGEGRDSRTLTDSPDQSSIVANSVLSPHTHLSTFRRHCCSAGAPTAKQNEPTILLQPPMQPQPRLQSPNIHPPPNLLLHAHVPNLRHQHSSKLQSKTLSRLGFGRRSHLDICNVSRERSKE